MNFVLKSSIFLVCLVSLIHCDDDDKKVKKVVFQYKRNTTLDCSPHGDVKFYQIRNGTETELKGDEENIKIEGNKLLLDDLRAEQIRESEYVCKKDDKIVVEFEKKVAPYILKPDKPSQTVTEGGNVELKCGVLYGENVTWKWTKNGTVLESDEKFNITSTPNETILTISQVKIDDKGDIICTLTNEYGSHIEIIKLRVKDALAALWPFLAIVAEVIILCLIILIYEKKCSKKPNNNEEDNEQAQNLMGKDNSDLKKRTTKA